MHSWGDKDKNGNDICYRVSEAAEYIGNILTRYGRINVRDSKEKFGTVRIYATVDGYTSIHSLIYPRHIWIHSWWPMKLDWRICAILYFIFRYAIFPYQRFIYRLAYKKAIKKWPDLREEILCCADYEELLRGL